MSTVAYQRASGTVRGLLCHQCNATLGRVGDDVALLLRMAAYVGGAA